MTFISMEEAEAPVESLEEISENPSVITFENGDLVDFVKLHAVRVAV